MASAEGPSWEREGVTSTSLSCATQEELRLAESSPSDDEDNCHQRILSPQLHRPVDQPTQFLRHRHHQGPTFTAPHSLPPPPRNVLHPVTSHSPLAQCSIGVPSPPTEALAALGLKRRPSTMNLKTELTSTARVKEPEAECHRPSTGPAPSGSAKKPGQEQVRWYFVQKGLLPGIWQECETANSACGSSPEAVMIRVGTKAQAGLLLAEAYMARTLVQISEDGVERTIGIKKHRLN